MCIIIYNDGTKKIDAKTLKTCFENNPDGAGVMYADGENVRGVKGLMSYAQLQAKVDKIPEGAPYIIHCRIATHGGKSEAMTQPFPVTSETARLKALSFKSKIAFAHNGIIGMTSDAKKISDTALFVKRYMPTLTSNGLTKSLDDILTELTDGSRTATIDGAGHVIMTGEWKEKDGIYYSNDSYKPVTYKVPKSYSYYGDYFDGYEAGYKDGLADAQNNDEKRIGWGWSY